jgi:hypothetical protein
MLLTSITAAMFGGDDIDPVELRDYLKLPPNVWRDVMRDKMNLRDEVFDRLLSDINDRILELMRIRDDVVARQARRWQARPRKKVRTALDAPAA